MNIVETLIRSFVEKSGGLAKCEELLQMMRKIPDEERANFIRQSAITDAGARQLMALALLGLSIAVEVTGGDSPSVQASARASF